MARRGDTKSSAVMARRRKKDDNEGLTDEERLWKTLDLYCTPPWAARAALEVAKELWPKARTMREPAAGRLHIADPARDYFEEVWPTDVYAHTPGVEVRDFLDHTLWSEDPDCDVIFSNPPFQAASAFVEAALGRARMGVVMIVRTVWIESEGRYSLFVGEHPLTLMVQFSERAAMVMGKWDPAAGSATAYAALYWSKMHDPMPLRWFPPGTRDRLWRRDDAAKYGWKEPMPLFPDAVGDVV